MDLSNSFEVARPIDETWAVLTDVERIAPCLPGAQLQEIDGEEYKGIVKVKVGPITAQYKGAAHFVEKDDAAYRAVLNGKGRDTRGSGNAEAVITARLEPISPSATRVDVDTDLKVTGKVAQFGRGVMADVSAKLMDQFADNLAAMLEQDGAPAAAGGEAPGATNGAGPAAVPGEPRRVEMPEPEAVDLLETAGAPVAKRVVPILLVIVLVLVLRRILRSR